MFLIFNLSAVPGETINEAGLGDDALHIVGHFAMYFGLCIALYLATGNILASVLLAVLFGVTDEYHQSFTPGRSSSIKDIVVNSSAALTAGLFLWSIYPRLLRRLKELLGKLRIR
jgi:VanZ family protein